MAEPCGDMDIEAFVEAEGGGPITIERTIVKPAAVSLLKEQLPVVDHAVLNGPRQVLSAAVAQFGRTFNKGVQAITPLSSLGDTVETIHVGETTTIKSPRFFNQRPAAFPVMDSEVDCLFLRLQTPDFSRAEALAVAVGQPVASPEKEPLRRR